MVVCPKDRFVDGTPLRCNLKAMFLTPFDENIETI
jgi:hypothetical protein